MEKKIFIGVDVSKEKVDIAVVSDSKQVLFEKIVTNKTAKQATFLRVLMRKLSINTQQVVVCCENTGIYGRPLEKACKDLGVDLWVENALKIKKATTDFRGKSDKKDALRIAEYAVRYQDKDESCKKLQDLLHAREDLVGKVVSLKQQLSESKEFSPEQYQILKVCYLPVLKTLQKQIVAIEEKVRQISSEDVQIHKNQQLLTSITGIGQHNALQFIIHTNNFTRFESANHLACYVGVVPFPNQSGTITKKDRVSRHAKTGLKKLLHMAAMSAIRSKGELQEYYIRKVKEGKNKMAVLNAIRNKLVHRMFAVIKRGTPYEINIQNISTT